MEPYLLHQVRNQGNATQVIKKLNLTDAQAILHADGHCFDQHGL